MDQRRWSGILELPILIVTALLLAVLVKTFLVEAFWIPSVSMVPTLEVGDRVLVEKVSYRLREPRRGEIIVFHRLDGFGPAEGLAATVRSFFEGLGLVQPDGDIDLIKRVIGVPGDTVEVRGGRVLINGRRLREPYAAADDRDFAETQVPPGELFMMGDNRQQSDDSRFSLGTVDADVVVGRAFVIMWPPARATDDLAADYPRRR
ncbi:MAG: signal peptidase I [Actinomycetota bacterium]|nr:signal peptidase I [Actinomycetota bacterium]